MAEEALNIEGGVLPELPAEIRPGRRVEWLAGANGLATACMAAAVAFYKPPSGIFNDHKRAYYVSIVSAGVAGLGEVCAAVIWLSGGHQADGHGHQRLARRCVLCASYLPLAFIAGLGGFRMFVK